MGGKDKSMEILAGRPMIKWVIEAFDMPDVAISANGDLLRFKSMCDTVLTDGIHNGEGPLAGLLAGLDWAASLGACVLLTAPADTPFLPEGLVDFLGPGPSTVMSNGRVHNLVATWPVYIADQLRYMMKFDHRRPVNVFADLIGMRRKDVGNPFPDPFLNVNTMVDLDNARNLVRGIERK
jgi:molybdopterin-guanine dinucleotide biosynthesis protein A